MTLDPSLAVIAICSIICFVAATIVGFSGFGFALIAVPILTLFLDIQFVVPLVLFLAFFSVLVLSANKLHFFKDSKTIITFIAILAGMILGITKGAQLLASSDTAILKKILGIVVILFALHILSRTREKRIPKQLRGHGFLINACVAPLVGILSGLGGGLFGTSGPPLVIYIDHFAEDKSAFRAQLLILFVLHDIFRTYVYIREGLLNVEVLKFALWLLPAVCLGLFLGSKMHFQVSEKTFGRAIAAMLLVSGLLLIARP